MGTYNENILRMLVHVVMINQYVDEAQVALLLTCAEKYSFSHNATMEMLNKDDNTENIKLFSECYMNESEQTRQQLLADMVKLACFDGSFDNKEMNFINAVTGALQKSYEQYITEGLSEFSSKVYGKPLYKRILSALQAFFYKILGRQREFYTLEKIAQQYRKGLYKMDYSERILELLIRPLDV